MPRALVFLAALVAVACSASDGPGSPDAPLPGAADARPAIDAPPGRGDASLVDAASGAPDARIDAGTMTSCPANEDLCDGTCLPRTSTGNCHGGCTVCPAPANGVPTCDGQSCGVSCDPDHHQCGNQCLDDSSPQSCGARCSPCPTPTNGFATCDGAPGNFACGVTCNEGHARCGGACVPEDATHCGASCQVCGSSVPAHSVPACFAGACTFQCEAPYLRGGSSCALPTAIAAAKSFTCALLTGGRVRCWSRDVSNLSGVTALSGGDDHACAIGNGGSLSCWGGNGYGQLGTGNFDGTGSAAGVSGLSSGVQQVSAGASHTCAVSTGGALRCWGRGLFGRLGNGSESSSNKPLLIYPVGVKQVAAGGAHTCALLNDGTVQCWGDDVDGQLGIPRNQATDCGTGLFDIPCKTSPSTVPNLAGVVSLYAGSAHTCALLENDDLMCWGSNRRSQLGGGSNSSCSGGVNDYCPTPVKTAGNVVAVSGGEQLTCYLQATGRVYCIGYNDYGQVGVGFRGGAAAGEVFADGIEAISGGPTGYHMCALTTGGQVMCWGQNDDGQLGDGTREDRYSPVPAVPL